jgi:hypothetical protein
VSISPAYTPEHTERKIEKMTRSWSHIDYLRLWAFLVLRSAGSRLRI